MKLLTKKSCPWEGQPQCPFVKGYCNNTFYFYN